MITVNLTNPPFSITYDEKAFLNRFPSSLISTTVDLTKENTIDLSHPDVTSVHLQILKDILNNEVLPQLSPTLQKGFNYLNVDLPGIIFTPQYAEFQYLFPYTNLLDPARLEEIYDALMSYAIRKSNYDLLQYIYTHTNPAKHTKSDMNSFDTLIRSKIWSEDIRRILLILLRDRGVIEQFREYYSPFTLFSLVGLGYPEVLRFFVSELKVPPPTVAKNFRYLIDGIERDPEHFLQYICAIIDFVQNYPVDSTSYNLFRAAYTGDVSLIPPKVDVHETDDELYYWYYLHGLLYTAALTNHPEVYNALLRWASSILGKSTSRAMARNFLATYANHPKLINPDMLRVISSYIKKKDRWEGEDNLNEQGYPELAQIVSNA